MSLSIPTILLIVQGIQAAVSAAPQVVAIAKSAKDFVTSLFSAGLISKEVQDAIHAHVDAICDAAIAGDTPPEFTVEPDPV